MSSLRRNAASGLLRSIRKYRDWLEYAYDQIPSRYALARDCACCELLPTTVIPGSFVDTGESTIVTGSGSAQFTGFFTESYGSFLDRFIPEASWDWGSVGSCKATLYPPLQIGPPDGFAKHATYGTNLNWCLVLTATLGAVTETQWHEYIEPEDPAPTSGTVTASVSYGARLMAFIGEVGRQTSGGTWGPRPRYNDAQTKDAVDLRGYKNAKLDWYYWDADEGGGSVTVAAFGHTLTVTGAGAPRSTGAGSASMVNVETREQNEEDEWLEASLSMSFFGSQALPEMTRDAYAAPPDDNGAIARTAGDTVYVKCDGATLSTFRRASLSLWNIQPAREVSLQASLVTPHGQAVGPFSVVPTDGPVQGEKSFPVNTHYPVDDPETAANEGEAITLTSSGTWTGTGVSYGMSVSGYVDAGAEWFVLDVMDEALNTIGVPAFGWTYSPTSLEAGGVSGDNWRCPLRIPAAAASWTAGTLKINRSATLPDEPGWSAGAGTTIDDHAVTGTGTLTISQTLSAEWLIKDYRWLKIRLAGTTPGQTVTLTIGSKTWTAGLSAEPENVIFDLCNPANASGTDTTTSVLQVRSSQGGWGWGVDGTATLTLQSDAAFYVWEMALEATDLPGLLLVGETLHRWSGPYQVGLITLYEGSAYEDEITTYATRGIFYIHDGRVVLDEEWGLTADGFQADAPAYRSYLVLNISDVLRAANLRQESSAKAAVALLEDKAPARHLVRSDWGGAFQWVDHSDFFNNQVEAYHLRPSRVDVEDATVDLLADYCVDRIQPGVGVSCALESRKWVGGGLHGLTVVSGTAQASAVAAGSSDAVSRSDGMFMLPGDELLASNQEYELGTGWGDPDVGVVEGTLTRVTLRK